MFDDELRGVLCGARLVLSCGEIRSNTLKQTDQNEDPAIKSIPFRQIPDSGPRVEIPEANTQSAREGPFSADGRVSCLGLSNLLRPACSAYCTVQMQRGRSWGFQVCKVPFFSPFSCRVVSPVPWQPVVQQTIVGWRNWSGKLASRIGPMGGFVVGECAALICGLMLLSCLGPGQVPPGAARVSTCVLGTVGGHMLTVGCRGSLYLSCKRAIHIRDNFPWSCHDDTQLTTGTLACAGSHR